MCLHWHIVRIDTSHVKAHSTWLIVGKDDTNLLTHPPTCHHAASQISDNLQIVLSAGGHSFRAKGQLFGHTSTQAHSNAGHKRFTAVVVAVFLSNKLRYTQALTSGQDGNTIHGIGQR